MASTPSTTTITRGQPGSKARFRDTYLLHKLHSLSGVLPIGGFLIFHLMVNTYALRGAKEFNTVVDTISYLPFVQIVEWLLIFIPILFHSIYGFMITSEMRNNTGTYQYSRNWLYLWQRVSGILAFAFMIFHVADTWGAKKFYETQLDGHLAHHSIYFPAMAYRFAALWYVAVYVVGIFAAASHLGNGLFNFAIRWGLAIGKEAQRIVGALGWAVGVGLTLLGVVTAVNFSLKAANYEGKGPITSQYKSLDELIRSEAQKAKAAGPSETAGGAESVSQEGAAQ